MSPEAEGRQNDARPSSGAAPPPSPAASGAAAESRRKLCMTGATWSRSSDAACDPPDAPVSGRASARRPSKPNNNPLPRPLPGGRVGCSEAGPRPPGEPAGRWGTSILALRATLESAASSPPAARAAAGLAARGVPGRAGAGGSGGCSAAVGGRALPPRPSSSSPFWAL